jgi:hypothetical protein
MGRESTEDVRVDDEGREGILCGVTIREPILWAFHTFGLSLEEVGGSGTEVGEALGRYDHGSRCDVE